jgi:hypothetical protein
MGERPNWARCLCFSCSAALSLFAPRAFLSGVPTVETFVEALVKGRRETRNKADEFVGRVYILGQLRLRCAHRHGAYRTFELLMPRQFF